MTGLTPNAPPWVQSVTPTEIIRQRHLGWPDFHPEDFCHICGHRNPVWSAPAEDWDTVIEGHGGIFCPSCWATLYEATVGRPMLWWFTVHDPAEVNPLQGMLDGARAESDRLRRCLDATLTELARHDLDIEDSYVLGLLAGHAASAEVDP